jgi:DNA-binding transcriptional regulator of glucitol operon
VFLMKGVTMAAIALVLYIAFGALALGWRCWMRWRRALDDRCLGVLGHRNSLESI